MPTDDNIRQKTVEVGEERRKIRAEVVSTREVDGFGTVETFNRLGSDIEGSGRGKVTHVGLKWSDHVKVLASEGVMDIMGDFFEIKQLR